MRILIIPDKFKGTLTAHQAAAAIAAGWKRARPRDTVELLPMTDGGDGFGEVMGGWLGGKRRGVRTLDAARRWCRAHWWWQERTRTAVVEAAEVVGLAMLPPGQFNPFELDTSGLAKVLQAVEQARPRRTFIGVGGSATNDGGFGLAHALGWQFVTNTGEAITAWPQLASCQNIVAPRRRLGLGRVTVVLDVDNPLLGVRGCTRVYGPQKGLNPGAFRRAESALRQLSEVMNRDQQRSSAAVSGAGAAGGLGFGLMSFLNARPLNGFSMFERETGLTARVRAADLVITGEGCLDRQSLMGKGVGELLTVCERVEVPCIAVCGRINLARSAQGRFMKRCSLQSLAGVRQASSRPGFWLRRAATRVGVELGRMPGAGSSL